ncbi:MAG: TRAP transporter small permease [Myxococcales bacterium]|nr:TRAP transporter small permease [Myxococcales bacterium]MCB9532343.1 TRAP transporter small permease [Myxococcales bacterium]
MSSPQPSDSPTRYGDAVRRASPTLRALGWVDDALYGAERVTVTTALLIMSGVVCLNILYQLLVAQSVVLRQVRDGAASALELWPSVAVLAACAAIASAVWSRAPSCSGNPPAQRALTAVTVIGLALFGLAVASAPSNLVVAAVALGAGAVTAVVVLDRPRHAPALPLSPGARGELGVTAALTVVGIVASVRFVPVGYSWAQKLALFLLLWVAFIGASMATHDGRHLRVDAVRKAIPERVMPWFDAASHAAAAVFTAGFAYLAYLYFVDRLEETPAPGQIPDWLKVLAIPTSLALVTARFTLRSAEAAVFGMRRGAGGGA